MEKRNENNGSEDQENPQRGSPREALPAAEGVRKYVSFI